MLLLLFLQLLMRKPRAQGSKGVIQGLFKGYIFGLYRGYIGIMEKRMQNSYQGFRLSSSAPSAKAKWLFQSFLLLLSIEMCVHLHM